MILLDAFCEFIYWLISKIRHKLILSNSQCKHIEEQQPKML